MVMYSMLNDIVGKYGKDNVMMNISERENVFCSSIIQLLLTTIEENQDPCYAFFEDVVVNNCQTIRVHPSFNKIIALYQVYNCYYD